MYSNRHVCHLWEEVCDRLNQEFGRRRSVQACYLRSRTRGERADALDVDRAADAVEGPGAEAESQVAHVDAHVSGRSASAWTNFIHSDALTAFGGDGGLDIISNDDAVSPAENLGAVDTLYENLERELLSDGLPTQVARLQKQQWEPLDLNQLLRPQSM